MMKYRQWRSDCVQGQVSARCERLPAYRDTFPSVFNAIDARADSIGIVEQQIRHGEKNYKRRRDLPGLLHLFPADIDRLDQLSPKAVLQKLTSLVKGERARGRAGHWRYSLARHIGLNQALRAEKRRLGLTDE